MLIAIIIAITLIAFYAALLVGLHRPEPEGRVQAFNYPVTFVHNPGGSWAVHDDEDDPNHTAALEGGYP